MAAVHCADSSGGGGGGGASSDGLAEYRIALEKAKIAKQMKVDAEIAVADAKMKMDNDMKLRQARVALNSKLDDARKVKASLIQQHTQATRHLQQLQAMKIPERDYSTHAANAANIAVSSEEIKKLGAKMDEADKNITAMENILAKFKGGDIIYKTINTTVAGPPRQQHIGNGKFREISTVQTCTTQQEIPCSQPNPELAAIYDAAPALLDKACAACAIAIAELSEIVLLHPHFIDMFTSAVHPIISVATPLSGIGDIAKKPPTIPPAHVTTITDVVATPVDIPRNVTDANTAAQLETSDATIIKLRESLAETAAQLSQAQTTIAELQASVQRVATEKAAATITFTKLQAEYDAMHTENCRINAAATSRVTELTTEKAAATVAITKLQAEFDEMHTENCRRMNLAASAHITEMIIEKDAAAAAITKLQTEYDTVSSLRTADQNAFEIAIRTLTNKLETLHEKCIQQQLLVATPAVAATPAVTATLTAAAIFPEVRRTGTSAMRKALLTAP